MRGIELLAQAQQVLTTRGGAGSSPRLAAFLARRALEEVIAQRCNALGAPVHGASTRSKLLVLRALDEEEAADAAAVAWNRLSTFCHLHAFEMQPSVREVEHLCTLVAGLVPATGW